MEEVEEVEVLEVLVENDMIRFCDDLVLSRHYSDIDRMYRTARACTRVFGQAGLRVAVSCGGVAPAILAAAFALVTDCILVLRPTVLCYGYSSEESN